ncbi:MAG: tetratricopeptide repeat protein [Proteobacteria bacterium]|nr:tetratricopeptide repeat protein [Pseudomonadota bacterium]
MHQRSDPEAASRAYREALRQDPQFVEAMVNLARAEAALGRVDDAHVWLDRAARLRDDYPDIHSARGSLALRAGDLEQALASLGRAVELAPQDPEILTNLGAVLIGRGLYAEAENRLRASLRIDPALPATAFNLALALDHVGEREEALTYYQRYLALTPAADPARESVQQRLDALRGRPAVGAKPAAESLTTADGPRRHRETRDDH